MDPRRTFLGMLRKLRRSGAERTDLPPGIMPLLDAAIEELKNALGNAAAKAPPARPKG